MFHGVARVNAKDERLFALAEVRDLTAVRDERGRVVALPELERVLVSVLEAMRAFQARRPLHRRLMWNRVVLHAWPVIELRPDEIRALVERVAPRTIGLGIELVEIQGRLRDRDGFVRDGSLRFFVPAGHDVAVEVDDPSTEPLRPLDEGTRRISAARRRGTLHPAEIVKLLAPARPHRRPAGRGVRRARTERRRGAGARRAPAGHESERHRRRHGPELHRPLSGGHAAGDPARRSDPGARVAGRAGVPAHRRRDRPGRAARRPARMVRALGRREDRDGFRHRDDGLDRRRAAPDRAVHPGRRRAERGRVRDQRRGPALLQRRGDDADAHARRADHDPGKHDAARRQAVARILRRRVRRGQPGHRRLRADHGPNGQAQYWATDLADACGVLLRYYEHTYVAPGERFPRRAATSDPADRDAGEAPHHAPGSAVRADRRRVLRAASTRSASSPSTSARSCAR